MELSGSVKIVTFVLLAISLKSLVVTSVTTSYEKLRTLADEGDQLLMGKIHAEVSEIEELIRNLNTILTQYSQSSVRLSNYTAEHPNDMYLLVKHHIHTWYSGQIDKDLIPALEAVINTRKLSFPEEDDLDRAASGLVHLQYVYRLKARDMFEGNYLGYSGPPLTMEDAYRLGRQAFLAGKLPQCIDWLQMVADMQAKAKENQAKTESKDAQQTSSEGVLSELMYIKTLALLGRAYLYANDTEKAKELYIQCKESGVTNVEDADQLLQELETKNPNKLRKDFKTHVRDIDENITVFCSRDKDHRVSAVRPYHMCRYKSNVFIPYQRFPEEILSTSPYVSVIYDVIYDAEIERVKSMVIGKKMFSLEHDGRKRGQRNWELRTVLDNEDPLVSRASQRVMAFTGLDPSFNKRITAVNFGIGGQSEDSSATLKNNMANVIFYLSDIEKGGSTVFPKLGISVFPKKGMALLWYTYPPHFRLVHPNSFYIECPVLIGNKWIALKSIPIEGNTFRRPCGPSTDSEQLDVEKIVSIDALKQKTY